LSKRPKNKVEKGGEGESKEVKKSRRKAIHINKVLKEWSV